jgi:hypothetical protein
MANTPEIAPAVPEIVSAPLVLSPGRRAAGRLTGGGIDGNERLTNATGALLIALLAVLGVTILQMRPLMSVHLFVGMMLLSPVALKMASTGYRFVRYYTHDPVYRRKGPPHTALRMLAPLVVASTLVVFVSGVWLLFAGPSSRSSLLPVHKVSFFVWLAVTAPHVLAHLPAIPAALRGDYGRHAQLGPELPGRSGRTLALAGAIVLGVVLAVLTIPLFGAWIAHPHGFGDH